MKVIRIKETKEDEFKILKEEEFLLALKRDLSYEKEDEMWIDLLAFKELQYELKCSLDQEKNCKIFYQSTEKKEQLLEELLKRYPQVKVEIEK